MSKYYFVGIKGSGMSSLAQVLHDLGNEVIGYDDNTHHAYTQIELEKRNIKIYYETPELSNDTIVVRTSAVRDTHKEIINAKELGLEIKQYYELLGGLTDKYRTIAISGCHGKTTTTALLSHIFSNTVGCSYIIGDGTGVANKNSDLFFIEACEYCRHFLNYHPTYTIITNLELDHVDYYKDFEDYKSAYQAFADQTKKTIIAWGDSEDIRSLNLKDKLYYGFNEDNDVICKNLQLKETGSEFDVYIKGEYYDHFDLPLLGEHMVLNALAVITICYLENLDSDKVKEQIHTFKGAKRRFQETFIGDVVTVDDYAHHPTEVAATIKAARQKYPNKEVVAIFKPNTYSRTKELYKDFISALNLADKAYVTDITCDRELPEEFPGVTSDLIINELENGEHIGDDTIDKLLKHNNAVLLFMSCKDIYTMKGNFEELLKGK
ncbi:MAG: UDP-N-acetylmuramate--L-alanine ligase [Firmicutes bacterium]|nr:UDP-N-acetylmuramate--L-alanine ligase [Bacillota bacterium]